MKSIYLNLFKKFNCLLLILLFYSCAQDRTVCECLEKGALIEKKVAGCEYLQNLPLKDLEDSVKNCLEKMMEETIESFNL